MAKLLRIIDLPPVWLLAMTAIAFGLDRWLPGLGFGWNWSYWLGNGLFGAGIGVMVLAVWEFLRARTTLIPRQTPSTFLQSGIYRLTRNPIYLGDALVLGGLVFRWDVLPALILVPVFMRIITSRFIIGEEAGLAELFGDEFQNWAATVRRWL
ncbi:isoprenylcysteine carboxylmethyltransferase family protein [Aliiroseovarius sp. F20344]|uniref:methyltransferase family protein n=1 Tax=Aliiroseovarius sp. F20344 TaxID=2926414 RepID=UPI001FF27750|nr:isoprenylcysteine carboxylmethyltransferase family protein [Aliiroseovarius sp. F20344]MCK0143459.1 isoprenylcysteine carboxylmethyltransferase family protein [Aliiroseovarius sp. F20344]